MGRAHVRSRLWLPLLVCAGICALAIIVAPTQALAAYSVDEVTIDATLADDGDLAVTETRTFAFDGTYHGVYWDIPSGEHDGRTIVPETDEGALRVQIVVGDDAVDVTRGFQAGSATYYEVTPGATSTRVTIHDAIVAGTYTYRISYVLPALATRWSDTGELYWQFVAPGWQVDSGDVTCTIHLPRPDGEAVTAGDTVRAWGHGDLTGDVSIGEDGTVTYTVPSVAAGEYAEARVTFPEAWLASESITEGDRLDALLDEEGDWADAANRQRSMARVKRVLSAIASFWGTALAGGTVIAALVARARWRRSHKPAFTDKYFRDVPTDDHPAVLAALTDGRVSTDGLAASVLRLADMGACTLSQDEGHGWELTLTQEGADMVGAVDRATRTYLFGGDAEVGDHVASEELRCEATTSPTRYERRYERWKRTVTNACNGLGYGLAETGNGSKLVLVPVIGCFLVIPISMVADTSGIGTMASFLACMLATIAVMYLMRGTTDLSSEAVEVKAKCEALKRWLKDFTHLDEAIPTDIVLWDRLLVMATAFGIADDVVRQLGTVAPQVLRDVESRGMGPWYDGRRHSPAHDLRDYQRQADNAVRSASSSSRPSSSSGGGGGFSSGGGGGFGSSGGGGAF